ncbi:MAG: histidine kinase [Leptolyngbya sp. SIO4C1]|nr:histidine kinase [Leptolyngbya sp. SIO4C1]
MAEPVKSRVAADLEQAKQEGQLRAERIKSIVSQAVGEASREVQAGSKEVIPLVRDAIATVVETLQERGETLKEDVQAAIEGALEVINQTRREKISAAEAEVKQLQAAIESEETAMQSEMDEALTTVEAAASERSEQVKGAVKDAIETVKNSEESQLMRKRYAQLRTQIAILKANLSAQYSERQEDVQHYLDEAQSWYERMGPTLDSTSATVQQQYFAFEKQLAEAGKALAKKERSLKQTLKELWRSASETFKD